MKKQAEKNKVIKFLGRHPWYWGISGNLSSSKIAVFASRYGA